MLNNSLIWGVTWEHGSMLVIGIILAQEILNNIDIAPLMHFWLMIDLVYFRVHFYCNLSQNVCPKYSLINWIGLIVQVSAQKG